MEPRHRSRHPWSLRAPARASLALLVALMLALLGVPRASAASGAWTKVGLAGAGSVGSIAVSPADPNLLLVSVSQWQYGTGGLCRSVDGGKSWAQVSRWTGGSPPTAVTFDPRDPNVVYLSVQSEGHGWDGGQAPPLCGPEARVRGAVDGAGGLFRSSDRGATWKRVLGGSVFYYVVDPSDSRVLYALVADIQDEKGGATDHVFRSGDGGKTWTKSQRIGRLAGDSSLSFDPQDSRIVYLTAEDGLYRSSDGGKTYSRTLDGRTSRVLVQPSNPMVVYATGTVGADEATRTAHYASGDRGMTWRRISASVPDSETLQEIRVNPADPSFLFGVVCAAPDSSQGPVRLLRSGDRGVSWSAVTLPGSLKLTCDLVPSFNSSGSAIFLSTPGAVLRSDDLGATWATVLTTPSEGEPWQAPTVTSSRLDPDSIVAADYRQNVYISSDAGRSFTQIDSLVNQGNLLVVEQLNHRALYATTAGNNGGMYGRDDIAGLWRYALPKHTQAPPDTSDPWPDALPILGGLPFSWSLFRP